MQLSHENQKFAKMSWKVSQGPPNGCQSVAKCYNILLGTVETLSPLLKLKKCIHIIIYKIFNSKSKTVGYTAAVQLVENGRKKLFFLYGGRFAHRRGLIF